MNKSGVFPRFRSESGQGIVEYILLLVVVITIATIFMKVFMKPYAKWVQDNLGNYVQCLLDQGELPGLGGTSNVQGCEIADFEKVAAPTNSGNSAQAQNDSAASKNAAQNAANSGAGRGGALQSNNGGNFKKLTLGGMDGNSGRAKEIAMGEEEKKSENGYLKINSTGRQIHAREGSNGGGRFLQGLLDEEKEKIKKRQEKERKVATAEEGAVIQGHTKKFTVEPKVRAFQMLDLAGDGWSFGKLLRILLIIGILIALILVIGGQLVQISKSMEK